MPDEQNTGVNGSGSPAPSPGANEPTNTATVDNATGATDQTQAGGQPGPVPYVRFQEVNERAKALESQNATIQAQASQAVQLAQHLISMQAQQARAAESPVVDQEDVALQNELNEILGTDEAGKKAERAIEAKARLLFKKWQKENGGAGVSPAEVQRLVNEKVNDVVATFSTNSQIQTWVNTGVISPDDGAKLASQVATNIQQNPEWGTKNNQPLLVSHLFTQMVTSGQIKPYSRPVVPNQPGTPFQPGGTGGGTVRDDADDLKMSEEIANRFPSLQGKDPKKIAQRWKGVEFDPNRGSMTTTRR